MVGDSGQSGGYTLSAGDTLGQYRIVRPLGKGGMGEVYLAEHAILTTRHAVKLLPAERSDSAGFLDRFHDEARVMARLEHPGIVKVTHADEQSGRHYLVMEFVGAEGGEKPFDLEEALATAPDNRLPPEAVARLGMQIAEAVGSAHKKGVVHRDLKPANVLLTSRDLDKASARVTDFGLARLLGEDWVRSVIDVSVRQSMSIGGSPTMMKAREDRSSTGSILGTYEYMSPEQRDGAEVDERSDIYALGVMLYRMVTGKKLMGRAKAASKLVSGLDPAWDDLIDACLEEDPADRPQNMGEVCSSLEGLCRKALSQRKEEDSRRQREAEDRRMAEERQREEDARLKKAAEESARKREQEQQRQAEEAAKAPEPAPPKRKSGGGAKWFVGLLVLAGVIGYGMWQGSQDSRTPGGRRPSQPPAQTVVQQPSTQQAATAQPAALVAQRPVAPSGEVAGATRTIDLGGGVSLELEWIPPGTYMRGSTKAEQDAAVAAGSSRDWVNRENPQHRVTISQGFWMGKYAVTQRQYQQLMAENPARFKNAGLDAPVESVNWHKAKEFCGKLQGRLSGDLRGLAAALPTEAEWEYACRAGTTTAFHYGNDLDATMANFDGNYPYGNGRKGEYRQKTVPVGSFRPNAFGLFDMHGNVWEWCEDWYGTYSSGAVTDPTGPSSGSSRVLRGGSWINGAGYCRSASRVGSVPVDRINCVGFRVVVR